MKICLGLILAFVGLNCRGGGSNEPITFRYISNEMFNNGGHLSQGTTFWATNHTGQEYAVGLYAIENKVGTNWVVQKQGPQPLQFQPKGKSFLYGHNLVGPQSEGYGTIQLSCQPTGTIWRFKAMVAPKLTGVAAAARRVQLYPRTLQDTNISRNPFDTNLTVYGETTYVFSQELSNE